MNNPYRTPNDPLDDYVRATPHSDFDLLSPLTNVRDQVQSASDRSAFQAQDGLFKAITTVVDQAHVTAAEIECVFELDRRIDLGRAQGRSNLALTIAQRKLAGYGRTTDIIDEHHVAYRIRQW
jgi:hypothetical protein